MPNRLEEIELEEISLVDVPATKRKFLFTKVAGDGSYLVCRCGHKEALVDFLKSASEECPECGESIEDSAVKIITKREGVKIMKKKLSELIKDFIGEDEVTDEEMERLEKAEKEIPPDAAKALKGALNILVKFKGDFPEDIKSAINTISKYVAYGYPAKKSDEEEEDVEKAGAKLSKATRELIKNVVEKYKAQEKAIVALESLIKSDTQKSAEILVIEEKMDQLSEKMDKLFEKKAETEEETEEEKKKKTKKKTKTKKEKEEEEEEDEDEEDEDEVKKEEEEEIRKDLKAIAERVEHLEEKKGTKKSLKGQDEDETKKSSKWASFFPEGGE